MPPRRRSLDQYPRPWFYRPEIYYAFIIFPPVWSVLTLRSPWHHSGDGFRNILVGGLAWFFIIGSIVLAFNWGYRQGNWQNLVLFAPGLLLTLLTQVQWAAHCARHGPPPPADADADGAGEVAPPAAPVAAAPPPPRRPRKRRRPGPRPKRRGRRERSGGAE